MLPGARHAAGLRPPERTLKGKNLMNGNAASPADWPLWEVFVRSRQGLDHRHCGSLHAADARMALEMARDVYTRRMEGVSLWVVPSQAIIASQPEDQGPTRSIVIPLFTSCPMKCATCEQGAKRAPRPAGGCAAGGAR